MRKMPKNVACALLIAGDMLNAAEFVEFCGAKLSDCGGYVVVMFASGGVVRPNRKLEEWLGLPGGELAGSDALGMAELGYLVSGRAASRKCKKEWAMIVKLLKNYRLYQRAKCGKSLRKRCVYFVKEWESSSGFAVGMSEDAELTLGVMQSGNPRQLCVYRVVHSESAEMLLGYVCQVFEKWKIGGGWFDVTSLDVDRVVDSLSGI